MQTASVDFTPEPDLHPLYPSPSYIDSLLSSRSGLTPAQRAQLVNHCLVRSCIFGELTTLQYLLSDPLAQALVNLGLEDDDGLGLVSLTIQGFGAGSDRDIEREECVRLLTSQGADLKPDHDGWTPLHHAALLSPPSLVSYLLTHGCSPFALTSRKLTPLDLITAHSVLPGREDVALLLGEWMRSEGWTGGRLEQKRQALEQRTKVKEKEREVHRTVSQILGIDKSWWGSVWESEIDRGQDSEAEGDVPSNNLTDYSNMLVFSPPALSHIYDTLISNYRPVMNDSTPANTLYLLVRFACLTCDQSWLEDLVIGAADVIEETFFSRAEDLTSLVFWLYNITIWLHLMKSDEEVNEACDLIGAFDLLEEVINSVFVFIIRFAERRIDQLFDTTLLDYSPPSSEIDSIQFESDWSFFKSLTSKKRVVSSSSSGGLSRYRAPSSPPTPGRPVSPSQSSSGLSSAGSRNFSSLGAGPSRRGPSITNLSAIFSEASPSTPADLTSFLTALHTLLTLSGVNHAFITQIWSQIMYWTSCELFNRVITRKKYLCRSRALQIGLNLAILEDWAEQMDLPSGIQMHFLPVKDLLHWLQALSSLTEFSDLIATIQSMKNVNPLQMRRAVRDYRYEVDEEKMSDECVQYLTQLQKDWERHRVKLGVEALRKEAGERERDLASSRGGDLSSDTASEITVRTQTDQPLPSSIDRLFGIVQEAESWESPRPPPALGELLDSRYMLPLQFPSEPRNLAAVPRKPAYLDSWSKQEDRNTANQTSPAKRRWRLRTRELRDMDFNALRCLDGASSFARWERASQVHGEDEYEEEDEEQQSREAAESSGEPKQTPFTRKPSTRSRGRPSLGGNSSPLMDVLI